MEQISTYQAEFIDFLVKTEALRFGEFTLKSGRKSPYFVNTGQFKTGNQIETVGSFYAQHIERNGLSAELDTVFGPAYKGIPLAVSTSIALSKIQQRPVAYTFNRKEAKTHGDKGIFVGHDLGPGDSLVIVEDVITAGTTLREIIPILRSLDDLKIRGVIISVDRCEKGMEGTSAVQEVREQLGLEVFPLITAHHILEYLSEPNSSGKQLTESEKASFCDYLEEFGA